MLDHAPTVVIDHRAGSIVVPPVLGYLFVGVRKQVLGEVAHHFRLVGPIRRAPRRAAEYPRRIAIYIFGRDCKARAEDKTRRRRTTACRRRRR